MQGQELQDINDLIRFYNEMDDDQDSLIEVKEEMEVDDEFEDFFLFRYNNNNFLNRPAVPYFIYKISMHKCKNEIMKLLL